jgi:hypothetical protein
MLLLLALLVLILAVLIVAISGAKPPFLPW